MNITTYWTYILIVFFITFIPGFLITSRFKSLNNIEKLSINFGFSILIIALLTPFFAFKLNFLAQLLFIGVIALSMRCLLKARSDYKFDKEVRFLLLVLVLGIVSKFFLQTLWEYPVMGGDWFAHTFSIPYSFEMGNWAPPRERPALFNLLIYSYHKLLGTSLYQYWISQIISVILNSIYIFPAYLIAKKAFGDWVARVSVLFMLFTPFLIFNTLYTWPKNAAMYGILMMIYFLFFSDNDIKLRYPLAGFFAGLGFWFHNYAVFYIGIALLLLIYKEKMYKKIFSGDLSAKVKKLSYFLIILLIILAPHFTWLYSYYGTVSTSKFIYYPLAVNGYESALLGDKQELFDTFYSTPFKDIIFIRISNAITTLTPATLPINPIATSFVTYNPIYYYTHDYPGALSALMYILVVIWFTKYIFRKRKTDSVLVGFLVLPLISNLILYGWREWGLVNQILHPTIPLLIILGINELNNFSGRTKTILFYMIFVVALVEDIIFSNIINNFYIVEGGINSIIEIGKEVTSDFEVSNFISAHFLLNNELWWNFVVSIILIYITIKIGLILKS